METNFAILERQKRLEKIIKTLREAKAKKITVSYDKFVGEAGLIWGLSQKKMNEYLLQLENSKHIKRGLTLKEGVEEQTIEVL